MAEQWKPVVGYEGMYEVSSYGRVKSLVRDRVAVEKFLSPRPGSNGYSRVVLSKGGVSRQFFVHNLVLFSFVGPRPEGFQGAHNDGNKKNNCLENLRWSSAKDNMADRELHGTVNKGEKHGLSKLTDDAVREIRRSEARAVDLAKVFGVSQATICLVRGGKIWKHVQPQEAA